MYHRSVRVCALIPAAFAVALLASALPAQAAPTMAERREAKALADEGLLLFAKNDFTAALDRLSRAEALVPLPTITLQKGRALERLGRWVEARTAYATVAGAELSKSAPGVHFRAVADAKKALEAIEARLPRLAVVLLPAVRPDDAIRIDGRLVTDPQASSYEVDPGEHVVEVTRGANHAKSTVTLRESERRTVELSLADPPPPLPPPPPPEPSGMPLLEILGWVGVGVGGASLLVATVTGIPAVTMQSDLEGRCRDGSCPPEAFDDLTTYDALRWTAGVTLFAGLAIAGSGVFATVWSRTHESTEQPAIEATLGPTSGSLRVRF